MQPIVVMNEWDNDNGQGAQVNLFWDIHNAIEYGKVLVEKYLKDSKLTRESFVGIWDEVYEENSEEGYTFRSTFQDAVFHVNVYEAKFMDNPPICKGPF